MKKLAHATDEAQGECCCYRSRRVRGREMHAGGRARGPRNDRSCLAGDAVAFRVTATLQFVVTLLLRTLRGGVRRAALGRRITVTGRNHRR